MALTDVTHLYVSIAHLKVEQIRLKFGKHSDKHNIKITSDVTLPHVRELIKSNAFVGMCDTVRCNTSFPRGNIFSCIGFILRNITQSL